MRKTSRKEIEQRNREGNGKKWDEKCKKIGAGSGKESG
jgi:hypothetical protein